MNDHFHAAESAAQFVLTQTSLRPRVGLVLGSGLGGFADSLSEAVRIPYARIPAFPRSTAIGHAGQMVIGKVGGVVVAAMQGRVHLYEGYSAQEVAFPMRVFGRMGIRAVILTNAAGGIDLSYQQGALVLIRDHIKYAKSYREFAQEEGQKLAMTLHEGVYVALLGPSYETPAEIRYLRTIGADLVGMSTVGEVIAARHMGIKVLAISCVTNMAAGILDQTLSHAEVLETAERVRGQFEALLRAVLPRIFQDVDVVQA